MIYNLHLHPVFSDSIERANAKPHEHSERIPACLIDLNTAYVSRVVWEQSLRLRLRKLFGTVIRNIGGTWFMELSFRNAKLMYTNTSQIVPLDIDRPFEL